MPAVPPSRIIRHLRSYALRQAAGGLEDAQLLERFLAEHDEAAFEALVRRYGPMVFGVCRRVLGQRHDAEDAFQATFLVLACKAASVRKRGAVGSWLYGVAYRTAGKARARAARRRLKEREAAVSEARTDIATQDDLGRLLGKCEVTREEPPSSDAPGVFEPSTQSASSPPASEHRRGASPGRTRTWTWWPFGRKSQ